MGNDSTQEVRVVRRFAVSAERVFDAWLDPEKARTWLFTTEQSEIVRVEIEARVGGRFVFVDRRDSDDVEHTGEYLEIDRPRRLVFTLLVAKFSDHVSQVAIDIEDDGAECQLTLTHSDVLPEYKERVAAGWTMTLDNLSKVME